MSVFVLLALFAGDPSPVALEPWHVYQGEGTCAKRRAFYTAEFTKGAVFECRKMEVEK